LLISKTFQNISKYFKKMDIVLFNESNTVLTPSEDVILIDVFGYSSGIFVGITLLPQVIKVFKTKSAKDLSHIFLALSLLAAASKLIYGILINELPIVVTAPIIGIETLIIMIGKCVFDREIEYDREIELREKVDISISIEGIIINTIKCEYSMIEEIKSIISKKKGDSV